MARKTAASSHTPKAAHTDYQLKIAIVGIRPPIWRRVQISGSLSLARLHDVIQTAFGWTDSHLHQFVVAGRFFGQPDDFDDDDLLDERKATLREALGRATKRFRYVYDFGDDWVHSIVVEKILARDSESGRPQCLDGRRRRPPEDCGGPAGYLEFLEAIGDPRHEQHRAMLDWVGGAFDSEAFDLVDVQRQLSTRAFRFGIH